MVKKSTRSVSGYGSKDMSNGYSSYFRMGFGLGLGYMAVQIITSIIALVFFITGFILLKREQAKEKKGDKASDGLKILAYILMFIGAIFAFILILPILGELGGEFE